MIFGYGAAVTCDPKPSRSIIELYIPIQVVSLSAITSDRVAHEERLGLIFQRLHQSFSLQVRVKTHRGPDLSCLLTGSHLPNRPFRVRRLIIDKAILSNGSLQPIVVCEACSKTHSGRANHLPIMLHLLETLPVVISLGNRLHCHL